MGKICVDVEAVREALSEDFFGCITDNVGAYGDEWLTLDCINQAFNSIISIRESCTNMIQQLNNCVNELDNILSSSKSYFSKIGQTVSEINQS